MSLRLAASAVLAALAPLAAAQEVERLTHLGEESPGTVSVTHVGSVYELTFTGDEVIRYQIDTADPAVAGGMIKVFEASCNGWPLAQAGACFRDGADSIWDPALIAQNSYSLLTGQSMTADSVVLDYRDAIPGNPVMRRRHTFTLAGKTLRVRVHDLDGRREYLRNYCGLLVGPTLATESPTYIFMQGSLMVPVTSFLDGIGGSERWYCGLMLDMFQSNAADWRLEVQGHLGPTSTFFKNNYDTRGQYKRLSDGKVCAPLDDTIVLTISSKLRDVLARPTAPPSPYLSLFDHRTVVILPNFDWLDYETLFELFGHWGIFDIAAYTFHDWVHPSRWDAPMLQNAGPDWWPARESAEFRRMAHAARSRGYMLAAYTAFNVLPATSPLHASNMGQIARDDAGLAKLAAQTSLPLMSISACASHARREALLQKRDYGLNMAYLDVQTYASPSHGADGDHLDQRATSPYAKTLRDAISDQKRWMRVMSDILEGPIVGESSIATSTASMEWLWTGHCESVQRVINTNSGDSAIDVLPPEYPLAPTNWFVIPEFELHVMTRLQRNHGNGLPDRFFGRFDGPGIVNMTTGSVLTPMTEAAMDRWRAYEITYGKTAYLAINGPYNGVGNYHTFGGMLKEHFLVSELQSLYLGTAPTTIEYNVGTTSAMAPFEAVFNPTNPLDPLAQFRDPRIHCAFPNGLEFWVNHGTTPWTVAAGGHTYTIPEDGYVAIKPGATPAQTFLSFSAIRADTNGNRVDYCNAPGRWEFFDGRGQVDTFAGLRSFVDTGGRRKVWVQNDVTGQGLREEANGAITIYGGTPPALVSLTVEVPSATLAVGQRQGARAVARYANGGWRDVTKLVTWSSTVPAVARVNQGPAITAVGPGTAAIQCTPFQGVSCTPASLDVP